MNTMLDALLAALPDSAYFERRDFGAEMREKLRISDVPFAAYLRGAAAWDPGTHPVYPVYSICKTNTVDNAELHPGYGNLVVTSAETGEIAVFPMQDDSGKMPATEEEEPAPAAAKLPRAKTYSVDDIWRALTPKDFHGGHGQYQAFLDMGDFQSQPYRFNLKPSAAPPPARPFESVLKSKGPAGKDEYGIRNAVFGEASGADLPVESGLLLTPRPAEGHHAGRRFPIDGVFRFQGKWPKEYERLPLHFLIAVKGSKDLLLKTLWLPRSKCAIHAGADASYTGRFKLDLADLFIIPGNGHVAPPGQAWISLVHREWRGAIVKYVFEEKP